MKHQTDRVHIWFFHIWGLSELHCHLKFNRLKKAILMKKTRRVAFFAAKFLNLRFWRGGKNWLPYVTPCLEPAVNPTSINKICGVCGHILCGMHILTTFLVYQQAWRIKDIIYASKIYALYVKIYHGPSPTPFGKYSIV